MKQDIENSWKVWWCAYNVNCNVCLVAWNLVLARFTALACVHKGFPLKNSNHTTHTHNPNYISQHLALPPFVLPLQRSIHSTMDYMKSERYFENIKYKILSP